jgi:diguanylate cyclase (GGDEF)-like protein
MIEGNNGRILVVEDDHDISGMLQIHFTTHGYHVEVAARGRPALEYCRRNLPDLIVLDIMLPDMDGYAVCQQLRTATRTSHIPIIFLTQKDERSDRITGLELGADDYITKPFDIEELQLRVKNSIKAHRRMNMTDPRTGLPGGRLIEDQLRNLVSSNQWVLMLPGIDNFDVFTDVYGFVAGDEILRFTALLINETIDREGGVNDFVGHAGGDTFTLVVNCGLGNAQRISDELKSRFDEEVKTHYNFLDREQGGIPLKDGSLAPLMQLSVGIVSGADRHFSDIREITETAAEARRMDKEARLINALRT